MATDVVMPQMGESIAEGTIVRWMKNVGDRVERDEPLFEISTDKVDAEIPSPVAGVITEIHAKVGDTVPVNSLVALIETADEGTAVPIGGTPPGRPEVVGATASEAPAAVEPGPASPEPTDGRGSGDVPNGGVEDQIRQRSSPLVRKIAKEHGVEISEVVGTGIGGRVTKDDILGFIDRGRSAGTRAPGAGAVSSPTLEVESPGTPSEPSGGAGLSGRIVPMSAMRHKIAEHMVASRRTSAHVHSVFEVDFARVALVREAHKAEFERAGATLTYLSFILKATVEALRMVPVVNASLDGENVVYHEQVNVGIAVALEWGLIVPVVKSADEKNLLSLSGAIADLADRARNKQLKPSDVSGGTFTITNTGAFGALLGMPIINQPQVAILGVGRVEKRPVVIEDAITIRPMAYLTLGYDHRVIDGAVADQFMSHVKRTLESWDPA